MPLTSRRISPSSSGLWVVQCAEAGTVVELRDWTLDRRVSLGEERGARERPDLAVNRQVLLFLKSLDGVGRLLAEDTVNASGRKPSERDEPLL